MQQSASKWSPDSRARWSPRAFACMRDCWQPFEKYQAAKSGTGSTENRRSFRKALEIVWENMRSAVELESYVSWAARKMDTHILISLNLGHAVFCPTRDGTWYLSNRSDKHSSSETILRFRARSINHLSQRLAQSNRRVRIAGQIQTHSRIIMNHWMRILSNRYSSYVSTSNKLTPISTS